MDFVSSMNNLMLTEEKLMPEWPQVGFGDPLPDLPFNLPSVADCSGDGLRPLPESLDHFDSVFGFSSSSSPYQYNNTWLSEEPSLPAHLDALCWPADLVLDPLSLGDGDFVPADAVAWDDEIRKTTSEEEEEKKKGGGRDGRSATAAASRLSDLGFDEIKNYFHMPITKAAKELNMGMTALKKLCRKIGILRWPHRKMKSLNSLIHNVQELGKGLSEEGTRRELERLEVHRRQMEENPEMQLTERTKKLRQACFKANYKRRRLSMMQQEQQEEPPSYFS